MTFYFFGLSSAANPLGAGEVTLFIPVPPPPPAATSVATVYGFNTRDTNHGDCATPQRSSETVYQEIAGAYVSNINPCPLLTVNSVRNSNPLNTLADLPAQFRNPFTGQQSVVEFEFKQDFVDVTGPFNNAQSHGSLYFCADNQSGCFYYVFPSANIQFNQGEEVLDIDRAGIGERMLRLSSALPNSHLYGSILGSGPAYTPGGGFVQYRFSINYDQFNYALSQLPANFPRTPASYWLSNYHINNEVTGNQATYAIFTSTKDAVLRVRK